MRFTRENVLWFAGLFEGEGCFQLNTGRQSVGLCIKMTDRDVLEKAQLMFGGRIWDGQRKAAAHHKQSYTWQLSKRDQAYAVVAAMYPFLGRRRQARAQEWIAKYTTLPAIGRCSRHGLVGTYVAGKCRCDACRTAYNTYKRKLYTEGRLTR